MATPNQKLATSLSALRKLQKDGCRVFRSRDLSRTHRERLLRNGFLQQVIKGWLIASNPSVAPGDSTLWYASFWEFCTVYCSERFGDDWHLSPEQSLLIYAESTAIPEQVIVYSPKAKNNTIHLPCNTSLYDLKQTHSPPTTDVTENRGLRLIELPAALMGVPETFYSRNPLESQVALAGIRNSSDLLHRLLAGGRSVVAGRLAGAFRHIGRIDIAEEILAAMKIAGFDVRESNPFTPQQAFGQQTTQVAPIVGRIQGLWASRRQFVIETFPPPPGLPERGEAYLHAVDVLYQSDAYHSLSIEGYHVTPELIERVQSGAWDPDNLDEDRQSRSALAARGYWQAFQIVKDTLAKVITGENPGAMVRTAHQDWYRELFQPSVAVGLTPPSALAGYRNDAVYLRGSRHIPPRREAVRDAMPALFDLLEHETETSVRAVLGHWLLGYIHPYPDGNGRIARFLMNVMLASGGYPWTIIRLEDRSIYLAALESASVSGDIRPFAGFIAERVARSEGA